MKDLQIKVFLSPCADKHVFERIVSVPNGMVIPFSVLEDSLRFLFGLKCVVSFRLSVI